MSLIRRLAWAFAATWLPVAALTAQPPDPDKPAGNQPPGSEKPMPDKPGSEDPKSDPMSEPPKPPELLKVLGLDMGAWAAKLKDSDPAVKVGALQTLPLFGPKVRPLIARDLLILTKDTDSSVRTNAIIAIGRVGFEGEETLRYAVQYLVARLNDPQGVVRYQAAVTLASIGPDAPEESKLLAIKGLIRGGNGLTDGNSWEIRQAAAIALGVLGYNETGPPDALAIMALSKRLKDSSAPVRREVIRSLMQLGRPGNPADVVTLIEELRKHAVRDPDSTVKVWSRVCLMRLEGNQTSEFEKYLDELGEMLKSTDAEEAIHAAQAIGTIGHDARNKVPMLVDMLDHDQMERVVASMFALGQMKGEGEPARDKLMALKEHEHPIVKQLAQLTIDMIDGKVPTPANTGSSGTSEGTGGTGGPGGGR